MKSLIYTFLLTVSCAVAFFLFLTWTGVDKDTAKLLATIIIGAFPKVNETLEKIRKEKSGNEELFLVKSFSAFDIHPVLAIVYVVVFCFAVFNLISFVAGTIAGLLHAESKNFLELMAPMVICFGFPIFIVSGRWMGIRCGKHPYLLAVSAGIILKLLVTSTDLLIFSKETYAAIYSDMDMGLGQQIVVGSVIYSLLFVFGVFLGRKHRLSAYLNYLLKQLIPESRMALVELAYEEVLHIQRNKFKNKDSES